MTARLLLLSAAALGLAACSSSIDEYNYGYAPAYRTLPAGFEQVDVGGTPYWTHGGRFYRNEGERGYVLVKPPRGHAAALAAGTTTNSPAPTGAPVATSGRRSWIAPGGGTIGESGPPKNIGRSPVRRRAPSSAD